MKKRSTRLVPKVKTKVKLQHRLRYVAVAGAFALGVFSVALLYNTIGTSNQSIANNRYNGMETLAEYKYRKQLQIDQSQLKAGALLKDFPVMINLKDDDLKAVSFGGKVVSDKGADLRFTKADGVTLLEYEIESYNPQTGELLAWVKMDEISDKKADPVFLYFSNKFAADESSQNAWNKTYKGVWHLKGAMSSKIPHANQFAQEVSSGDKEVYVAAEKNSSQFPCLNTPEDVDITGDITVSAWVMVNDKKEQTILSNQNGFNGGYRMSVNKDHRLEFMVRNQNAEPAAIQGEEGTELMKGQWYHVAAVYSDEGDSMATYINGKLERSMKTEISMAGSTEPLQIGREPLRKSYYFGGKLDEVHVSNIVRRPEWIAAEYASQARPKDFVKAGQTEAIVQQISMSLLTFDGEAQGGTVELKWLTAMEIENDKFTIERSNDGVSFEAIGSKPGAGNSNEVLSYSYRDNKPMIGTNYYRVKLTGASGEEYSMITPVNVEAAGEADIRISPAQPNPFVKDFQVEYVLPNSGKAHVKLMSVTGDVVHEEDVVCEKATPRQFFFKDDKGLKPGVYFFSVAQEEDTKMVKLIKRI
ncbi:MAG: hypothetical protein RLZZ543_1413 [Bacteroidota bacterium]|jgi:hypothetical protein